MAGYIWNGGPGLAQIQAMKLYYYIYFIAESTFFFQPKSSDFFFFFFFLFFQSDVLLTLRVGFLMIYNKDFHGEIREMFKISKKFLECPYG